VIILLNLEGGVDVKKKPRLRGRGCGFARVKWITLFIVMLSFIMTSMAFWGTLTAWAGTVALPRSGQWTCYDSAGTEISCAGTGQDGDLQSGVAWPSPRFTDNGDGTITDNLTGLMWLKDANCMVTHYPEFDVGDSAGDGLVDWVQADEFVNKINKGYYPLCGASRADWRLPNAIELESLFHAGKNDPMAWLTSEGFSNVGNVYWSSTTYFANPPYSRFVFDSIIGVLTFHEPISIVEAAVWPVRGTTSGPGQLWKTGQTTAYVTADDGDLQEGVEWPDPRFTNNGDGTITDNLTGLTWLRDMNCIWSHYPLFDTDGLLGDGAVFWQHALDFVRGINRGTYPSCGAGYTDWRLPNIGELMSICHYGRDTYNWLLSQGFINPDRTITYWSSTSFLYLSGTDHALELLWDCSVNYETKIAGPDHVGVWPVRGGTILERIATPSPPSGPTTGVTEVSYTYSTAGSVSNLGAAHTVEYRFDWGDQTTSEWSSSGSASHSWSSPGIFDITAQARCSIDHEVTSSWSDGASITISLPPGPDLTGTWKYLTATCKTSKSKTTCKITGELEIQNIGNQDASSSIVKFYLSDDGAFDENDTFLKKATIGKMKAKTTKTTKLTRQLQKEVLKMTPRVLWRGLHIG
jgi:hypothetical protein